ncbi:MATE family efflux transporter [Sphingobacteriaceae bacterium WQ 2009]|uniref:Multidrug-efflux transporter n=1 Tax=Rhinopithecimicrobium faecis TaxID=2820698 RepID=A0A8T4H9W7_9SPHI|nr:MATE family efflux transporter [Sphingobacteriaceae bacterium WQ 2009]
MRKLNSYKPYLISTFTLAGPIVISQLGHTLVHTADSIIVGHFAGTIPLAAVSLVHAVFLIVLVVGLGIGYGITPLIAQANGREEREICGKLLSHGIIVNMLSSIILFCLVYFGSMFAIEHLDQDPAVVAVAKPYLLILSISIFPLMIFTAFKQFAEGLGYTKQAMHVTIWGNVLNIILAIIFVKGMFGITPMGVQGVGYSTLIDRFLMMLVMSIYVFRSAIFKRYLVNFKLFQIDGKTIKDIVRIGMPVALQYVFEIGAFAVAALIAGKISATVQAAHQIAITLASMAYMMGSGIAAAATIKTGNAFGNNNYYRLQKFANSSYALVLVLMSITAILFAVLNQYLPYIFTADVTVVAIAAQLLIIAGLFQLFDGTQVVGLGVLRGIGDVNIPTFINFVAYWIIGLPVSYLLGIHLDWGVIGIWYGLTLGLLSSSLLLFLRYQYMIRKLTLSS